MDHLFCLLFLSVRLWTSLVLDGEACALARVSVSSGHVAGLDYFLSGRALYPSSLFNLPLHSVTGKSLSEQTSSRDSVTTGGAVPEQPDNAHLSHLDALSLLWSPPSLLVFSK